MKRRSEPSKHEFNRARPFSLALAFFLIAFVYLASPGQSPTVSSASNNVSTSAQTMTPTLAAPRSVSLVTQTPRISSPQAIPGQTQVDANTVAMYHFDTQIGQTTPDATGVYTGTLLGNASIISPGWYGNQLYTDGNASYVRTGYLGPLSSGTIEAFVDFRAACPSATQTFTILSAGGEYGSNQTVMRLWVSGYLNFSVLQPDGTWQTATSAINPCRYLIGGNPLPAWPYNEWRMHHVAGTWGPRGVEIWVDGNLYGLGLGGITPPSYNINYSCNPQLYAFTPNPTPICKTPVAGVLPNGYSGGLLPYSTFLIGCDSSSLPCFNGQMDEVRISNIQRTFDISVVPTSTPTPTRTLVPLTGAYPVDGYTMALYHLDSLTSGIWLSDATGYQQNARVWGNASIVPNGRYQSALSLQHAPSDSSWGDIGILYLPAEGTEEAWVNLSSTSSWFGVTTGGGGYNTNYDLIFMGRDSRFCSTLCFIVNDNYGVAHIAESGIAPATLVGGWHHLAGTWGSRGIELWVDGIVRGTNSFTGSPHSGGLHHLIGCGSWSTTAYNAVGNTDCMQGIIDEVRISTTQRKFAPLAPVSPPIGSYYAPLIVR